MGSITGKLPLGIMVLVTSALLGCTPDFRNHGYIPNEEILDEIVVGVDTRASVEDVAGSPTSASLTGAGNYYYVRSRVKSFAYRAPEVVERQVLAISFDDAGTVSNIERFGLEDGRVISLQKRVTEASTVDLLFRNQIHARNRQHPFHFQIYRTSKAPFLGIPATNLRLVAQRVLAFLFHSQMN